MVKIDCFMTRYWGWIFALVLFGIYFQSLFSPPFGDDYGFIFKSAAITEAPNPFIYWFSNTSNDRSWPLTYSIFWCLFKFFGHNFFLYKLTNLIFHFLNTILLVRILKRLAIPHGVLIAFLYAIHPVNAESIVWIFQLKTVLSVTFFLISYELFLNFIERNTFWFIGLSLLFFTLSLLTKITAILAPLIYFYHIYPTHFGKLKKMLIVTSFCLASVFLGLRSVNGVVAYSSIEASRAQNFTDYYVSPSLPIINNAIEVGKNEIKLNNQLESFFYYAKNLIDIDSFLVKSAVVMNSVVFYIQNFLGLSPLYPVYPNLNFNDWSTSLAVVIFFVVACGLLFFKNNQVRFGMLFFGMGTFPILGYFYVPYMKNSYVADHWNYLGAIGLAIAYVGGTAHLGMQFKLIKKFSTLFVALIFLFVGYKTYSYSNLFINPDKLYEENIKVSPKATILYEYLFARRIANNRQKESEKLLPVLYTRKLDRFDIYQKKVDYTSLRDRIDLAEIYITLNMVDAAYDIVFDLGQAYPDNKEVLFLLSMLNRNDHDPVLYLDKLFSEI